MSKEIGGYFELACPDKKNLEDNAICLNTARNALRYIIRAYNIKKILVPYYTCPVVWEAISKENIEIAYYHINENLEIDLPALPSDYFLVVNNYFGIKGNYIKNLAKEYPFLIVDDAQSFFSPKVGLAHFKSPRKFVPLPDGGLAICDKKLQIDLSQGSSWKLCLHLLIRADIDASAGYECYKKDEKALDDLPVQTMSNLTYNLLSSYDFSNIKQKRLENFNFLHSLLKQHNELNINIAKDDIPMVYPFLTKDNNLRKRLIDNKIYVAKYWPEIEKKCNKDCIEFYLQSNLVPLPIDQRYTIEDMKRILEVINV